MPALPALPAWSRRAFLLTSTSGALSLTLPAPACATPAGGAGRAGDEYAALRRRWLDLQLGTGYDPAAEPYASRLAETGRLARTFRDSMAPAGDSLFPGLRFDPPSGITAGYSRLWTMTQACLQPGTGSTGDATLLADVVRGVDHLSERIYNPSTARYGNWWEWQIGSPRLLMDIVTALHDELTDEQRLAACAALDHFVPDSMLGSYTGTSTGANRVDLCRSVMLRGIAGAEPAKIVLARDALSPVFPHVTTGDGLYADGSFVQHTWVAYSGTYGQVLLDGLGRLFALLAGSAWDVTDPGRTTVLDSVENAFAPLIHDGLMMDSVNGRAISRGHLSGDSRQVMRSDHFHGHAMIAAVALLAGGAPEAERTRWHSMIKGWIARDTVSPVLTDRQFGVADLARLHAVAAAPVPAAPEPVGHKLFAAMDRAVHRRPGWTANIAMSSERISAYECGNGENPRGWHTGAGMLYWWPGTDQGDQYTDWFWPTVDWYRLPGTTVSTRRLADREGGEWGEPRPAVRWVGGATDGEYAAVGQHLKGLGSTLEARKSWFCAADAVICLGAGITCTDGVPVETVVDNRNLGERPAAVLTTGRHGRWAHLDGHGGWVVLPAGADRTDPAGDSGVPRLRTLREARTGAWRDINTTGTPERRTRHYQTLWLDHGTDPVNSSYGYILMPGASRRAVAARAADRGWLEILDNSGICQSVVVRSLGLAAANFWRPATVGALTVTAPASVLVRARGRTATLHISEPMRSGLPLELVWDRPVRRVVDAGPSVEVLGTGRRLRLRVTPGTAGVVHGCEVTIG
ncbi:polysaccharide lyase 8 family protein [Streptomyces sp. NPDC047980]|uniref:polysaccharide lyase 8 family protein n=1 Tax=Streptomyces sp. NPDC047980 TaxID=3365494 RepID=UPI003715C6AB